MLTPETSLLQDSRGKIVRIEMKLKNKRIQIVPDNTLICGYTNIEGRRRIQPIKQFFKMSEALHWLVTPES
jgi:hypothetical protein